MKVLRYAQRYGQEFATIHDDIESAVSAAEYDADEGESALVRIEVWEHGVMRVLSDAEYKQAASAAEQASAVRRSELLADQWVIEYDTLRVDFYNEQSARAELAEIQADIPAATVIRAGFTPEDVDPGRYDPTKYDEAGLLSGETRP